MKNKFKLRPELNSAKYWIHLVLIATLVLGALQLLFGGNMFTLGKVILSAVLIGIADIIVHTVLRLD